MLTSFPEGLVAVVSDSYDIFAACKDLWGGKLKSLHPRAARSSPKMALRC